MTLQYSLYIFHIKYIRFLHTLHNELFNVKFECFLVQVLKIQYKLFVRSIK